MLSPRSAPPNRLQRDVRWCRSYANGSRSSLTFSAAGSQMRNVRSSFGFFGPERKPSPTAKLTFAHRQDLAATSSHAALLRSHAGHCVRLPHRDRPGAGDTGHPRPPRHSGRRIGRGGPCNSDDIHDVPGRASRLDTPVPSVTELIPHPHSFQQFLHHTVVDGVADCHRISRTPATRVRLGESTILVCSKHS